MLPEELKDDPRWQLVERIAESSALAKSPRLGQLLRHVAERALLGRADELSEQKIGVNLFGRSPDYSPAEDNIVRSHARLLRQKLEEYYAGPGADETCHLTIPKGGYLPHFTTPTVEEALAPAKSPKPKPLLAALGASFLPSLLLGLIPFGIYYSFQPRPAPHPLWSHIFQPDHLTILVTADSGLVMLENARKRSVTLGEYVSRQYQPPTDGKDLDPRELLINRFTSRRYTSFTDLNLAARLSALPHAKPDRFRIAFARDLAINDFKINNIILSGAEEADPWVSLYHDRLHFHLEKDQEHDTFRIRNQHPAAGEKQWIDYDPHDDTQPAYGHVAYLAGSGNSGNVLLLSGTTTAGTEAASDFVFSETQIRPVLERAARGPGRLGSFELLLITKNVAGSSSHSEIFASRFDSASIP